MNGRAVLAACAALFAGAASVRGADDLRLESVTLAGAAIRTASAEKAVVSFRLSGTARVRMDVWDGRDLRVRSIASADAFAPGEHSLEWDGRDDRGAAVPPEAYFYTLVATSPAGGTVTYDLTDLTRGQDADIAAIRYDPATRVVSYVLPGPSRVGLRVGFANGGPLLATLVNWEPRVEVAQSERWAGIPGVDDAGLVFWGSAFRLPQNTIVVLPPPGGRFERAFVAGATERRPRADERRRMYQHSQHTRDVAFDFPVRAEVLAGGKPKGGDVVVLDAGAVLRVDVPDAARHAVEDQRFEIVFYVDGVFLTEFEQGYLPFRWPLDQGGIPPGEHLLTVNLRGYEGYFGAASVRITRPPGAAGVQSAASP